jgi:hypothetical protein
LYPDIVALIGTAFDIREEEGDGAGRENSHRFPPNTDGRGESECGQPYKCNLVSVGKKDACIYWERDTMSRLIDYDTGTPFWK